MISDSNIIELLYRYGHFKGRVAARDLSTLRLTDRVVVDALESYQHFLSYTLDPLTAKHHGRVSIPDGVVGPATRELFTLPRCEVPDFGVSAEPFGDGSWPMPCQKAGVKFHVAKSGMPSRIVSDWPEIQRKVVQAYALLGLRLVEVPDSQSANILTSFTSFFGSTIGIAQFNSESCSDRVTCKLSNSYVGHNAGLWKHELGHNMNLGHTRGGTMNPSIMAELDPVNYTWTHGDPSYQTLVRYFGGTPIDGPIMPPPPDVPPPVPGPGPTPVPPPVIPAPSQPFRDFLRWLFGW